MAHQSPCKIALMSIKPEYANRILDGSKRMEFRKTKFAAKVSHVLIYATSPVKLVIGYFAVDTIEEGSPNELWSKYQQISGIELEDYFSYFCSSRKAYGIKILNAHRLEIPIRLVEIDLYSPPPQSFRYVTMNIFDKALNMGQLQTPPIQIHQSKPFFT